MASRTKTAAKDEKTAEDIKKPIEVYRAALAAADTEFNETINRLRDELVANKRGAARTEGERKYNDLYRAHDQIRAAKKSMAKAQLSIDGDRFVVWMMDNAQHSYPDHVEVVLANLPLDINGLRKLSADNGWCSEFDRLLSAAIRAGVIDDGRSKERKDFEEWLRSNFSIRETWIAQVNERVDQIIAAEAAEFLKAKKANATPVAA